MVIWVPSTLITPVPIYRRKYRRERLVLPGRLARARERPQASTTTFILVPHKTDLESSIGKMLQYFAKCISSDVLRIGKLFDDQCVVSETHSSITLLFLETFLPRFEISTFRHPLPPLSPSPLFPPPPSSPSTLQWHFSVILVNYHVKYRMAAPRSRKGHDFSEKILIRAQKLRTGANPEVSHFSVNGTHFFPVFHFCAYIGQNRRITWIMLY